MLIGLLYRLSSVFDDVFAWRARCQQLVKLSTFIIWRFLANRT